jgi:hypothetical protein
MFGITDVAPAEPALPSQRALPSRSATAADLVLCLMLRVMQHVPCHATFDRKSASHMRGFQTRHILSLTDL